MGGRSILMIAFFPARARPHGRDRERMLEAAADRRGKGSEFGKGRHKGKGRVIFDRLCKFVSLSLRTFPRAPPPPPSVKFETAFFLGKVRSIGFGESRPFSAKLSLSSFLPPSPLPFWNRTLQGRRGKGRAFKPLPLHSTDVPTVRLLPPLLSLRQGGWKEEERETVLRK